MPVKSNNCCVTAVIVLFEVVALAAALIAICSTFWLDPLRTAEGSVLPGVDRAGLWRVCYDQPDGPSDTGGLEAAPAAVQLLSNPTERKLLQNAPVATDAPASSAPAAPRRAAVIEEGTTEEDPTERLTNASQVVADIKGDFENNLPWSKKSAKGCTADVKSFYSDVWGQDFETRLQAVRALTLAFAFFGAIKLLSLLFCGMCCGCCDGGDRGGYERDNGGGGGGRRGLGWLTTLQVLAGWAGWLVFLWILLDIRGNTSAHETANAAGIVIDEKAAGRVESYWGHSFWLFLASTLVTTIGAMFGCC